MYAGAALFTAVALATVVSRSLALTAGEQITVNKIKALLTTFATDAQLGKICQSLGENMYNGQTVAQMGAGMQNIVMGSLSGSQMIDGLNIYNSVVNAIGGSAAAKAALSKAMTVFGNNLQPLVTQIQTKVNSMKSAGKPKATCLAQQSTMVNSFFTKARVQTIMQRLKTKLAGKEWTAVRKGLTNVIKFGQYGL
ncbi:hypothetical protein AAVH_08853 [Aphelenchoides avenae]|nr:hypothetical protein AAVH_08853 [Aphelenchus avenae]